VRFTLEGDGLAQLDATQRADLLESLGQHFSLARTVMRCAGVGAGRKQSFWRLPDHERSRPEGVRQRTRRRPPAHRRVSLGPPGAITVRRVVGFLRIIAVCIDPQILACRLPMMAATSRSVPPVPLVQSACPMDLASPRCRLCTAW
jgi:hypothetical protein